MSMLDQEMRTYAQNGLRSADGWAESGRQIVEGATPRTTATFGAKSIPMYAKEQTKAGKRPKAPKPAAPPAAVEAPSAT
jgi:hypothetical protein